MGSFTRTQIIMSRSLTSRIPKISSKKLKCRLSSQLLLSSGRFSMNDGSVNLLSSIPVLLLHNYVEMFSHSYVFTFNKVITTIIIIIITILLVKKQRKRLKT
uniref:Uncharacterized protein n=1 Tax=Cacopsylla melanoneura TaxID=428564 RepID=A0A8D8TXU9_9HEMI